MKKILLIISLLALVQTTSYSFQLIESVSESEDPRRGIAISEEKFDCFKTLQCLMKEAPLNIRNLNDIRLTSNRMDRIQVNGSTDKIRMEAVYNGEGDLIQSTVVQRNIALPRSITTQLVTGEFGSWQIIGNELTVENFDKKTMRYKVILKRGEDVKIEYFDSKGEIQNHFS